jgi:hypothetical protein
MLADIIGGDIDGAWWPYSASMANELSQLTVGLHRIIDDITDIKINWSTTESALLLETLAANTRTVVPRREQRLRLMLVTGAGGSVKLLVVPHLTTPALGLMLLRQAARIPISDADRQSKEFETASRILRAAHGESVSWTRPGGTSGDAIAVDK